jgi:hypothetical protein
MLTFPRPLIGNDEPGPSPSRQLLNPRIAQHPAHEPVFVLSPVLSSDGVRGPAFVRSCRAADADVYRTAVVPHGGVADPRCDFAPESPSSRRGGGDADDGPDLPFQLPPPGVGGQGRQWLARWRRMRFGISAPALARTRCAEPRFDGSLPATRADRRVRSPARVVGRKLVAVPAAGQGLSPRAPRVALGVPVRMKANRLLPRKRYQVRRVDAEPVAARLGDVGPGRDRAAPEHEGGAVRVLLAFYAREHRCAGR